MRKQIPLLGEMTGNLQSLESSISDYETGIRYINGYFDIFKGGQQTSDKVDFVKRPGVEGTQIITPPAGITSMTAPSCIDGFFHAQGGGPFLLWRGFTPGLEFKITYGTTVLTQPAGWTNGSSVGGMLCQLDQQNTPYSGAVTNSEHGGVFTSAAWTRITDADYLAGPVANGVGTNFLFVDGYLLQANWFTQDVFNSDLNAPLSWGANAKLRVNLYAGQILKLVRIRNLIAIFKTNSIEFIENQGHPSPGSPFGQVKHLAKKINVWDEGSIKEVSDGVIFIGYESNGQLRLYKLFSETLQVRDIGNQYINSALHSVVSFDVGSLGSGSLGCAVIGYKGHEFYILPFYTQYSLVYDNSNGTWMLWTHNAGGTQVPFKVQFGIFVPNNTATKLYIAFDAYRYAAKAPALFTETAVDDSDFTTVRSITFKWISPRLDFGTMRRKFMGYLELVYSGSGEAGQGVDSAVTMTYYDSDGGTETSGVSKTASQTGARLVWRQLGSFRRRRLVFEHTGSMPIRLQAIEVDIDVAEDGTD